MDGNTQRKYNNLVPKEASRRAGSKVCYLYLCFSLRILKSTEPNPCTAATRQCSTTNLGGLAKAPR